PPSDVGDRGEPQAVVDPDPRAAGARVARREDAPAHARDQAGRRRRTAALLVAVRADEHRPLRVDAEQDEEGAHPAGNITAAAGRSRRAYAASWVTTGGGGSLSDGGERRRSSSIPSPAASRTTADRKNSPRSPTPRAACAPTVGPSDRPSWMQLCASANAVAWPPGGARRVSAA